MALAELSPFLERNGRVEYRTVNELWHKRRFHETRVAPFFLPNTLFLFKAFHDYIVAGLEINEDWLDRQEIVDLIGLLFVLRMQYGETLWDAKMEDALPELSRTEIHALWSHVHEAGVDLTVFSRPLWTYFRDAWKAVSGERLVAWDEPGPIGLQEDSVPSMDYFFKKGVAHCLQRLYPITP